MTAATGTVVNSIDGQTYRTVLMPDGKWWTAENARTVSGSQLPPNGNAGNVAVCGYLYSSLFAAPAGMHNPSYAEWDAMVVACGGYTAGTAAALRSSSGLWLSLPGTDAFGFDVEPAGYYEAGTYQQFGAQAWFLAGSATDFLRITRGSIDLAPHFAGEFGSIRYIVDSGNIPDVSVPAIFGVEFSGLERGYSVSINRHVTAREAIGGGVRLIPQAPSGADIWTVDAEIRLTAEQSLAFEAAAGAYGSDTTGELRLPARGGLSTFCGLAPASFGAEVDTYVVTAMRNPESLGRVAPAVDLFAYRVTFDLIASANAPIALTATVPAWLPQKWATHDLRDSSQWEVYASPSAGLPIRPAAKVKHGRGRGHSIALDALDDSQADHVTAWYRNSRAAPVTITIDRGPEGQGAASVYLTDLSLSRNMGLLWSGSLEVVEA